MCFLRAVKLMIRGSAGEGCVCVCALQGTGRGFAGSVYCWAEGQIARAEGQIARVLGCFYISVNTPS